MRSPLIASGGLASGPAHVPRFPPARLRHSTASRLAPLIGEKGVAKMLGHRSDEVTVRHYIEQNLPDVVRLAARSALPVRLANLPDERTR